MKQFFEGLANQNNAPISSQLLNDRSQLEAGGHLSITKGIVEIKISYWCKLYDGYLGSHIKSDDFDWDFLETKIGGLEVDGIDKFEQSLKDMGLSSVAKSIKISEKEIYTQIFKAIQTSKSFRAVFGSRAILFDAMNEEDQADAVLDHAITNYANASAYLLHKYKLSESSTDKPTIEELVELKKSRTKS